MPQYIEQFMAKRYAKFEQEQAAREKSKWLMEDARDYYGFAIHEGDPKLAELKELRQAEEMEEKKKQRKAQKQAKVMAKLQVLASTPK